MSKLHFYRLPVSSATGQALNEIYDRGDRAVQAASELSAELGAVEFTMCSAFALGGIGCMLFVERPSEEKFDLVEEVDGLFACVPNTSTEEGREILKQMSALPVVKVGEVCEAFGFDYQNKNFNGSKAPRFFRVEQEWFYVKSDFPLYIDGMHVISEEEFSLALQYFESENR